ncbi:MAG: beta-lactamase family protein [Lachnospiraceae bacterium]|nr:beta-lactamase family protein [Lachnospiraceae bacterium]
MNRTIKAIASAFCAVSILMCGTAVYADEGKYTPSGTAYGDIGSTIEKWAADNPDEYVSFAAAVFDRDGIIYENGFGFADRENNIAADADTVYEWGSVTKLTVWVSVMQLYEQGRIDLNADVCTYLPEGFFRNLKYDDSITMLNLMNHNAGWGEGTWALQVDDAGKVVPLGDALRDTEPPQIYRPGEVCSYSNWGAALAGYIVERITGESFADYVHENIFEPLGMEHTAILPDHSDNGWVRNKRNELVAYSTYDGVTWNNNGNELIYINLYPAGSATGTISDMAKFARSFVSDDCPLFSKKETRDFFLSPSSYLGDTEIVTCCHGLWPEEYENAHLLGHSGGTNACSSNLLFDTETGIGMVFMTSAGRDFMPELLFGNPASPDLSMYASEVTSPGKLAGVYAGTRSIRRGIIKIVGYMSMLPLSYKGDNIYDAAGTATIEQISDNMIVLEQNGYSYPGYVYKTSNGTTILTLGSQSFAMDETIIPAIALLVVFLVITVLGFFMILFKLIGILAKKNDGYQGSFFVTLSQIFRIFSVIPPVVLIAPYFEQYGLTHEQGYFVFGVEAACVAVFVTTLVSSVIGLVSKKEDAAPKSKYILSITGNCISIATLLTLGMLNIWGI